MKGYFSDHSLKRLAASARPPRPLKIAKLDQEHDVITFEDDSDSSKEESAEEKIAVKFCVKDRSPQELLEHLRNSIGPKQQKRSCALCGLVVLGRGKNQFVKCLKCRKDYCLDCTVPNYPRITKVVCQDCLVVKIKT
jgi:hypothetical protein